MRIFFFLQINGSANPLMAFFPLILFIIIIYFLLIRPQQKSQQEHRKMIENLRKNDNVVTAGGIHGIIQDIKDDTVLLKVADNVKILVDKTAIAKVKKKVR